MNECWKERGKERDRHGAAGAKDGCLQVALRCISPLEAELQSMKECKKERVKERNSEGWKAM